MLPKNRYYLSAELLFVIQPLQSERPRLQKQQRNKSASIEQCKRKARADQVTRPPSPDYYDQEDQVWKPGNRAKRDPSENLQKSNPSEEDAFSLNFSPLAGKRSRKNKEIHNNHNAMINGNGRASLNDDDLESQSSDSNDAVAAVSNSQSQTKNIEKNITKTLSTVVKSAFKSPGPGRNRTKKIEAALNQISKDEANDDASQENDSSRPQNSLAIRKPRSRKNSHSNFQENNVR